MRGKIRKTLFGTKRRTIVASIAALLLIATSAFAAWTVLTASGFGSAKTGALAAPTISNGTTLVADVFPSAPASWVPSGTLTMTINNPNAGALVLQSFTIDDDTVTGGPGSCDWSINRNLYLFVKGQTNPANAAIPAAQTGLSIAVPPGVSQVSVPGIIGLTSDTPSICQNTTMDSFAITNAMFTTG